MESLLVFLHIIAWVIAICSTTLLVMRIIGALTYSKLDKLVDDLHNQKTTWPVKWPAIIALICWAFIIAF